MAIVNELVTSLGFKLDPKALDTLKSVEKGISKIVDLTGKLAKSFAVAKGVIDFFTGKVVKESQELYNFSKQTGISVESLQKWSHVARKMGYSAEELTRDLAHLKEVGHSDEAIFDYIDRMNKSTPEAAARFAQSLGVSQKFLTTAQVKGVHGILEDFEELEKTGTILSHDQVEQTALYAQNLNGFLDTLDKVKTKVLVELAPVFNEQLQNLTSWLDENGWFVEELTIMGKGLSKGFQDFFDIIGKIGKTIAEFLRPIIGDMNGDLLTVENTAKLVTTALLVMTGAKVLNALAGLATAILKVRAAFVGTTAAAAASSAAGSAAGGAAGGAAAGAAGGAAAAGKTSLLTRLGSLGAILGGGWMVGEEIANIQNQKQQYNLLERLVQPISEYIVGEKLGEYRYTTPPQQKHITNNITNNFVTPAGSAMGMAYEKALTSGGLTGYSISIE